MNSSSGTSLNRANKPNQNIQVYVRVRPINAREKGIRSTEVIEVHAPREIVARHNVDTKLTKKFTFDRTFGPDSKQHEVYEAVVGPLIEEVLSGYNCTVFAYGQTGTGKTHTMVGTECAELKSSWEDDSEIGIIPRALSHLFDELRMMELEFSMRISYLELYNEELCDLLASEDATKIRIFDDSTKKGSVIIQGLEEIPVHSKDDVYKLLEKGKERRKTATTLMNAQSSRSHTVFSILVHIKENGMDGEEMLKTGKLNLVDLAGSENVSKAGNEKGIRTRETVNINQSLLTLGRVITALVERTPHIPYRESKLTRLLQESLGGRTKTSIIATISPGHKDLEETLSTLEYAHRAKNIQNRPEVNQKLTKKTVLKEYTEEIDKLKRDLMAARDKNGIYLAEETYNDLQFKLDSQNRELNEKVLLLKALKDELASKEKVFNEVSLNLVQKTEELMKKEVHLSKTRGELQLTKKVLTTTKRRYKEKKVLLQSHVKTEEVLLNQASQLIEVADIATSDTVKLHNTIDRRRDVDVKIQSACEQFTSRMQDSFELMDENLKGLQKDHSSHLELIIEEIANNTKYQDKFVTDAMEKVESVSDIYHKSLESFTSCLLKHLTSLSTSSTDHKSTVTTMLSELNAKECEMRTNFQQRLAEMETYFEQLRASIQITNQKVTERIVESNTNLSTHTNQLKQRLKGISQHLNISFEAEIVKLNANVDARNELTSRRQNALSEFVKQMQLMDVEDRALIETITNVTGNLEATQKKIENALDEELTTADQFCEAHQQVMGDLQNVCNSFNSEATTTLKNYTAVSHLAHIQQDAMHNDVAERLDKVKQSVESNSEHVNTAVVTHQKEFDNIRDRSAAELSNECEMVRCIVKHEHTRLKEHDTQNLAFTTSLKNNVQDYASVYNAQMRHCVEDVSTFRTSEIKTYAPTGQTPSKRDFIYPKALASTSPHTQIVKRLRQENDWSDLEMTINEVSEIGADLSDSEVILNSTPIEMNSSEKSSIDANNKIRDGLYLSLKVPPNNHQPNSRKSSPVLAPFNKQNKENLF